MKDNLNKLEIDTSYFNDVDTILNSIRDVSNVKMSKHQKVDFSTNVVNVLCKILDTQNKLMRFIISNDTSEVDSKPCINSFIVYQNDIALIKEVNEDSYIVDLIISKESNKVIQKIDIDD